MIGIELGLHDLMMGLLAVPVILDFVADFFTPDEPTIQDVTPREFRSLREPLASTIRNFLTGGTTFQGPTVAPLTPEEQAGITRIRGLTSTTPPTEAAASDLITRTLRGQFLDPASNPFLQSTFDAAARPVIRNFQDVVLPDLRAQFTRGGQFIQPGSSSPFAATLERAGTRFTENLTDLAAQIFGPAYQFERGLQQGAIPLGVDIGQQDLRRALVDLEIEALPRNIEQMGIDRAIANFFQSTGLQLSAADLARLVSQPALVGVPGAPSPFEQIFTGAATAIAPFALAQYNPFDTISNLFSSPLPITTGGSTITVP